MSDEELERLAAEMKNVKPSEMARKQGVDVAMAAFDAEFAAQDEKMSDTAQGYETEARPTDQMIKGRTLMSKFKSVFNMPPRSAMLLGSALAAMTFAMVIMPPSNMQISESVEQAPSSQVAAEVETAAAKTEKVIPGVVQQEKERSLKLPTLAADADQANATEQVIPRFKKEMNKRTVEQPSAAPQAAQGPAMGQVFGEVRGGTQVTPATREALERLDAERNQHVEGTGRVTVRIDDQRTAPQAAQGGFLSDELRQGRTGRDFGFKLRELENDRFEAYEPNPITAVKETPVSTFSIDVDTASYSFLRSTINQGRLPRPGSIRLEEIINYFPYDYAAPTSKSEPFKANVTVTPSPWNSDNKLMHIGIKGYVPPVSETPSSNIVFLIDTSGSMRSAKKLPLLIESFKVLLETLDEDDTVSIVTYAGSAGTVLEPTPASETGTIKRALNRLQAGGSTAGAAGLALAYEKAQESFMEEGVNRVILATDGDFNVGFSSPDEMKRFIEAKRKSGIFLSVLGFGRGNYNDALMQSLAQNGNGVAAYIDSLSEAKKVLADEAGSALIPIAKDVKIQVEFNPATIAEYRLIGYETRALKREDFNNDKVDAGDINSGHSVTAIYELTPVGSKTSVDDLRYARAEAPVDTGSDEFAFIKIRHKLPKANKSTLQTIPIGPEKERRLGRAADDVRFATAVAAFGQKLRGDRQLSELSYKDITRLASDAQGEDEHGYRAEFLDLVREVDRLSGE